LPALLATRLACYFSVLSEAVALLLRRKTPLGGRISVSAVLDDSDIIAI
jgi:hypothetical protein